MKKIDLKNSVIFKGVDEEYVDEFLAGCEAMELAKDEYLFRQNEIGDTMYIVESGELEIQLEKQAKATKGSNKQIIETVTTGTLIGELCVFGQKERSASAYALKKCKLLKIKGEDFRVRIFAKELDALLICYNIAQLLSARLGTTDAILSITG